MGFEVDYPGGLQRRVIAMFDPLAMEIEELWKKHKQRFDQVPSLDWAQDRSTLEVQQNGSR